MLRSLNTAMPMDAHNKEIQVVTANTALVSTKIELVAGVAQNFTLGDDTTFIDITNGGTELALILMGTDAADSTGNFTYGLPGGATRNQGISNKKSKNISFISTVGTTLYLSEF